MSRFLSSFPHGDGQKRRLATAPATLYARRMIDFLVIGGGIAGASAAYFLAERGSVVVLEREEFPGYHSTGRSAALYTENYGNAAIRGLTLASRPFFETPPASFGDHKLLTPRGVLMVAAKGDRAAFEAALEEGARTAPGLREIGVDEALRRCPVLSPEWLGHALYEPAAMDMDVHAIHQGFLRGLRERGGEIVANAAPEAIERGTEGWLVRAAGRTLAARIVVNAAGAWSDEVATLAGARPVGLIPKRRTAFTIEAPDGASADWPMAIDVHETLYFKPESGRLLVSPADETPTPPCDVQPDEMDIAVAASRLEEMTTLRVARIARKWAGLRSFVDDKTPVLGFAPEAPGFLWVAGQGGYGIMTSPAMGRAAAALAAGEALPRDVAELGVAAAALAPARLTGG
jgi:D-arginine dehydrogenase